MTMSLPTSKDITSCPKELETFTRRYGLHNMTRTGKNQDGSRVNMNVETIRHLLDRIIEKQVSFNVGSIVIKPLIIPTRACENCQVLVYHGKKGCKNKKAYYRCLSTDPDHFKSICKNQIECKNCGLSHLSSYENWEKYKSKILTDNDWLATVLVGENIISSKIEILKWVSLELTTDPLQTKNNTTPDLTQIQNMINATINPVKEETRTGKNKSNKEFRKHV